MGQGGADFLRPGEHRASVVCPSVGLVVATLAAAVDAAFGRRA
ncbi:hypothetical protein [Micromonospora sp. NPDC005172]